MVPLSRLDGSQLFVNAEMIEFIEMAPNTVVSLTNGKKLIVRESAEEIISRVVDYKRRIIGVGAAINGGC